jgi:hypothetical protein
MLIAFHVRTWSEWRVSIAAAIVSAVAMLIVGMAVEHWLKLPTTLFRDFMCPFMAGCMGAWLARRTALLPALLLTLLLSAMTISSLAFVFADHPLQDRAYILGCFFLFNTSPLIGAAIVNWMRRPQSSGSQLSSS